jgi:hypothetical protein
MGPVRQPALELQKERHMVDASGAVADLVAGNIEIMRQLHRRALHGMAQADLSDGGISGRYRPGVDRHRVDILQQDRVRADLHHVGADTPQMRRGAQAAHDAADAQRVGDRLAQAVALGQFEIGDGAGLVAADLKGDDDEIRAAQRAALFRCGFDARLDAERRDHLAGDDSAFLQPQRIDVHQRDRRARQSGALQYVANNVLHEHCRAGADESDPEFMWHCPAFPVIGFEQFPSLSQTRE